MPKLRVRRKAYTRKDGTRVKATTFKIRDRGARGRTPKARRWFEPSVETGWEKGMPASNRRRKVLRAHGGDELASARAMQALANVTTDRATRTAAQADANYFFRKHKGKS